MPNVSEHSGQHEDGGHWILHLETIIGIKKGSPRGAEGPKADFRGLQM